MTDANQQLVPTTVTLRGRVAGCELTISFAVADKDLKDRVTAALEQMTAIGVEPLTVEKEPADPDVRRTEEPGDSPLARLARELALPAADLAKVLGIKGDTVQLYRASQLAPSDAAAALCLGYEKGLGKSGMPYQAFGTALESIHVKMKAPLSTFCFNMIRDGMIQRKAYEDGRSIVLSPAGEQKGEAAIKALMAGGARADPSAARGRRRAGGTRQTKRKRK